jgi:hypothetical protein
MSSGGNQFSGFKYSGGKNRMAGDYLKDFSERYTDKTDFTKSQSKDYRGNVKNNNVASFLGNSIPNSAVQQPLGPDSIQKPESKDTTAKKPVSGSQPSYLSNEAYLRNLKTIENYDGKNGATSNAVGAQYNADLMSGINYDRAVRQNEKLKAGYESQASIAAGNDHGSGDWKAPKSKEYYDYLETYDGPTSYKGTIGQGQESYEKYDKWVKDSRNYKKAWEGIDYKKVDDRAVYGLP